MEKKHGFTKGGKKEESKREESKKSDRCRWLAEPTHTTDERRGICLVCSTCFINFEELNTHAGIHIMNNENAANQEFDVMAVYMRMLMFFGYKMSADSCNASSNTKSSGKGKATRPFSQE